jgi:hypothetical protein
MYNIYNKYPSSSPMEKCVQRRATLLAGMFCATSMLLLAIVLEQGGTLPIDTGNVLASLLPVL